MEQKKEGRRMSSSEKKEILVVGEKGNKEGETTEKGPSSPSLNNESDIDEDVPRYTTKHRRRYPGKQVPYTDKDRAAAMGIGARDTKVSLQVKKKKDDQKDDPKEKEFIIHHALVGQELRLHNPRRALKSANRALELQPGDERSLIARSKCLLQLGENEKAYQDAETALAKNPDNVRAIYQKAEALYLMGNFEFALVFYQRGLKLRPDMEMFRLGVQKAQEAIRSSVGAYTKIKLNKKQIDKLRTLQSQKLKNRMFENEGPQKIMPSAFDLTATESMTNKLTKQHVQKEERLLLGLLARDKEFCRTLSKNKKLSDIDARRGQELTALAEEVVNFLDVRQEFWRQQKPVNPVLKKSEIVRRVHLQFRPSGGINANLPHILQRVREKLSAVQTAEAANQWEVVLRESRNIQRLLLPVKFSLWPQKADVLCAAYCAMGKACVELGLLEAGLNCHLKGLEIANARNLATAKDVALEYLGSTYVCLRMYDKAIHVWRQWLPRCTNPLLRTWLLNELGHCHLELGDLEKAKDCGKKAMDFAVAAKDMNWLLNAIILVTQCEVNTGNFRNGARLMEEAVLIAEELKYESSVLNILRQIKEKVCDLVKEANITSEDIEMPIFHIAEEETLSLFPKEFLKILRAKLGKGSQQILAKDKTKKQKWADKTGVKSKSASAVFNNQQESSNIEPEDESKKDKAKEMEENLESEGQQLNNAAETSENEITTPTDTPLEQENENET